MIFTYLGNIFLAARKDNQLVDYKSGSAKQLKLGFTISEYQGHKHFRRSGFLPTPDFTLQETLILNNKGLREWSFGWVGFSKYSQKAVLVVAETEKDYECMILTTPNKWEDVGSLQLLPITCVEKAPDDFECELKLAPTRDYLDYYDGRSNQQ